LKKIRTFKGVKELDARMVKIIPQDDILTNFEIIKKESAVLLINVDYSVEKERVVTWNLRKIEGVKWARAMWGPSDIIAIIESNNHESMRDLICDNIKTMKGVKTNCTFYCYPR
jgi:DNA-binding Lrp family transcriptional regulator